MWTAFSDFRKGFAPPPSLAQVRGWADAGSVEIWQPGGKGGTVYVRPRDAQNDSGTLEDEIGRALLNATT